MSWNELPPEIKRIIMDYKKEMDILHEFQVFFSEVMYNLLFLCI